MARKTIKSGLFEPTVTVEETTATKGAFKPPKAPIDKEITHNTSTRIPLTVHEYFEKLAVENGYSTHSLRIYAMAWFVKEHQAGNIGLERDKAITSKRALAMPEIE